MPCIVLLTSFVPVNRFSFTFKLLPLFLLLLLFTFLLSNFLRPFLDGELGTLLLGQESGLREEG